ncbi:uncharacterized protein LOC127748733 [Frankliniella occidentalis]|uniref:Uncharacterized protein LOC127748733 n=1 Tax=Frankliniella occidentalis TaxID=133901 RepID=A0A9C6XUP3_FRAOC|nr:uncharacterized protein LOC127748733 [Frankliniella occidentalis]
MINQNFRVHQIVHPLRIQVNIAQKIAKKQIRKRKKKKRPDLVLTMEIVNIIVQMEDLTVTEKIENLIILNIRKMHQTYRVLQIIHTMRTQANMILAIVMKQIRKRKKKTTVL